jgi:hypothetical protein
MLDGTCAAHLHDTIRALGSATLALHRGKGAAS